MEEKPLYYVTVARDFRAETVIEVTAWSEEEAMEKARKRIQACLEAEAALTVKRPKGTSLQWEVNEKAQDTWVMSDMQHADVLCNRMLGWNPYKQREGA